MRDRRTYLKALAVAATGAVAGCGGPGSEDGGSTASPDDTATDEETDSPTPTGTDTGADAAVAAEWNVYRARAFDALALGRAGHADVGAAVAEDVFARFEGAEGEYGAHERLEHVSEEDYEGFEGALEDLQTALSEDDVGAASDAAGTVADHLGAAQRSAAGEAAGDVLDLFLLADRGADARVLAARGDYQTAADVATGAYEAFEEAAVHDAVAAADSEAYERFESGLTDAASAAESEEAAAVADHVGTALDAAATAAGSMLEDEGATGAAHLASMQARAFDAAALARFDGTEDAASSIAEDVFATFEEAAVHERLESADHDTYESFEDALSEYADGLSAGEGDVEPVAAATRRAQFAVVGALSAAPGGDGDESEGGDATDSERSGGPNVVEGTPEDADHVVTAEGVSFDPAELTVAVGDTVAFENGGDEAHTVTAVESELPADAAYWASGGFDSEEAARSGWEDGEGAVRSGQSYVHTFETAGEHPYVCIPHEAAGMTGTVVVEDES